MVKLMGIEPNLFQLDVAESDLIEQAYEALGKQIAYCTSAEEVVA